MGQVPCASRTLVSSLQVTTHCLLTEEPKEIHGKRRRTVDGEVESTWIQTTFDWPYPPNCTSQTCNPVGTQIIVGKGGLYPIFVFTRVAVSLAPGAHLGQLLLSFLLPLEVDTPSNLLSASATTIRKNYINEQQRELSIEGEDVFLIPCSGCLSRSRVGDTPRECAYRRIPLQ